MNCPDVWNDGDDRAVLAFQSPTASSLWLGLHFLSLKLQVPTDKGKSPENAFALSKKKVKVSRLSLLTSVCYLDGRIAIVDALEGKAHL